MGRTGGRERNYPFAAPTVNDRYLRSPDGSRRRLADVADRDRGRLSWRVADLRKPTLPNGRSATLTSGAQKGVSERERVDRVVGSDIKPVSGGDERLKMVQTAHCLRRSCERLAAIGPERVQPVVALGAHDQCDRIRAAVGRRYDRRAGVGDGEPASPSWGPRRDREDRPRLASSAKRSRRRARRARAGGNCRRGNRRPGEVDKADLTICPGGDERVRLSPIWLISAQRWPRWARLVLALKGNSDLAAQAAIVSQGDAHQEG